MRHQKSFRPHSRLLALEPRVLFDGAAAIAAEQQAPADIPSVPAAAVHAASTLVVIDSRVNNAELLSREAGKVSGSRVVMVGQADDGLGVIAQALEDAGRVDAVQIYSHGAAGQFTLGSRTLSADNVATAGDVLQGWSAHLSDDADILLLGCNVGDGRSGAALLGALAALTGADVAASTNDTGSADAGGDWTLEAATGSIESIVPTLSYEGLLANAGPTVSLSGANIDALLGGQLSFTATFTNNSSQVGFSPFIDLILPATGKDGAGAGIDDGITFVSATYLGQTVRAYTVTFDAAGNATHPLAKDATGAAVIVNATTYGAQAGDQLAVLELPYASVTNAQPAIPVVITVQLSNLADTEGSPDLNIKVRGGFQYGNDSADNPTSDPSLFESGMHDLLVHPTSLRLTQSISAPEGETVTGPNFTRTAVVTATPPPGQTLTNIEITQSLPNTVRITSITPGAGGSIASITVGGDEFTDPTVISQVLAFSPYLVAYTVRYASLTASESTVVEFYVPERDAAGNNVLNPVSGDDRTISFGAPTASGEWLPLDTRDQAVDPGPPAVLVPAIVTANGSEASFVAKSIALKKSVATLINVGSTGLSPGDTLQYTLNLDVSDYFAVGKTLFGAGDLTIIDAVSDGQSVITNSVQLTVNFDGQTYHLPITPIMAPGAPGSGNSIITLDIAQALLDSDAIFGGALVGDIAFDGVTNGATTLVVTYQTTVNQAYVSTYPQSEINEGDAVGNNVTVSGTFLSNYVLLTGESESDGSSAQLTVPTNSLQGAIVSVNGGIPPANGELKPGDIVTFKLAYDLVTGDYENFKLTGYLPLPLFDLSGINWSQGAGVGQWTYGGGNTNPDTVDVVRTADGNAIVFDFGSYATADIAAKRVEVQFTLQVGNQPFADQRPLTVLGQSSQLTTIPAQRELVSSGAIKIASIAEPVVAIKHGVVAVGAGSVGMVSGTTGTWAVAGSAGVPFAGSVTDLAAVDGNVTGIDGGDLVRLATAIENTGGLGAFDVAVSVNLPAGFTFSGGGLAGANLAVYRGDGTALIAGTDYSVSGNTVTFLDNGGASLLPGRAGTASDNSGANVLVITCDVVAVATISASRNLQTSATLVYYSSSNGGPDFTPVDPNETAEQIVAAPVVAKVYANGTISADDSSATHTTGSNLVVGEAIRYDILVTLPEGTTQSLRITDLIPAGLMLDTSFGTGGYQIITTTAFSGALTANFAGTVSVGSVVAPGGDGNDITLNLGAASSIADNSTSNNSFVIRVQLIASNTLANQVSRVNTNDASLIYSDPDGSIPNGSTAVDQTVSLSGAKPTISIVEPKLVITQLASTAGTSPPGQVDAGDLVTYTITIRNGNAASDFNAFDISFSDLLPAELSTLSIKSVGYAGGATNNGGADFTLTGSALTTAAGANIDIPKGGSVTLIVEGLVNSSAANVADFTNTAEVRWTSLDGGSNTAQPNERTGVDGVLNNGSLNDYRLRSNLKLLVVFGANISHVGGLPDTPTPAITDQSQTVAVGEIIRYRTGFVLAEGATTGATVKVALADGLSFVNDGTATIGLLSDLPLGNAPDLTTGANPDIAGSVSKLPDLISADLSNTMTAVLSPTRINIANPREIVFSLGDLSNTDLDSNKEVIYLDFNVRVDNSAAVDTTKILSASAKLFSGGGATLIDKTQVINESVVEPSLRNLQKTVTDFDPSTSGSTGTATITLAFSNEGDGIAYDGRLTDTMSGGSNYQLQSVIINGTSYAPGGLPAGVTVVTAGGITANFSVLATGSTVALIYTVDVANNVSHAPTDATLTWSSLPESFSAFAGTGIGIDGSVSGERDDGSLSGGAPNTYIVREGAGLGVIAGTLWDDTSSATASANPDGAGIAGQTVTLTWAGVDGDLNSGGDNKIFTVASDAGGAYSFGVLAAGRYTVSTPASINSYNFGTGTDPVDNLAARVDSDGVPLASIAISALGEGVASAANIGFVRENDAPVNTLPAAPTTLEDTPLAITGITVADVDADSRNIQVTLSVLHGRLNLATAGLASSSGIATATVVITGSQAAINAALATLTYLSNQDYNGTDKLTVTTSDLGNFGDHDGNGTPGQTSDALTDMDELTINITPVNDAPIGVNDFAFAFEAGGVNNSIGGLPGLDAVLDNDLDVDIVTNGDVLTVTKIGFGTAAPTNAVGLVFAAEAGNYGDLLINAAGAARYIVDNNNAAVQALRLSSDVLVETFTYELRDVAGLTSTATITVTIRGRNDTPVAVDDNGTATEKGGVNNSSGGGNAVGNVLSNDTDVDLNGETKAVTGVRFKRESQSGTMIGVPSDNSPVTVTGNFGALTIQANGDYTYAISNEGATAVQRLVPGDTLIEFFSYAVSDSLGDTDIAQIRITINGADDNPVASDDQAVAQAKSANPGSVEVNPTGNVIRFKSRPGTTIQPGGNGIDADADRADQPNTVLRVTGIRTGSETLGDTTTAVSGATVINGSYGTLTINPDGSFSYDVDSTNPAVIALPAGVTLDDTFTYRIADTTSPTGLTDLAQLNIIVRGANDPPLASDVFAVAVEAGGVANGSLGTDPTGDALVNDFDPDGNALTVLSFRTGTEGGGGTAGVLGSALQGLYGSLTLNADGTYSYAVDNTLAVVQALRTSANLLSETFTYQVIDDAATPESDFGEIIVTISGRNDNPVGADDVALALESGGFNNGLSGVNPSGNVLTNDSDVDAVANGETRLVSAVRAGAELSAGAPGSLGVALAGSYGSLTLDADGSYIYAVDNSNAAVQALRTSGDTLTEFYTYTVIDADGATDLAQLTITIAGASDTPVANPDASTAVEAGGVSNGTPGSNGSGNVLANDTDVDAFGETKAVTAYANSVGVSGTLGSALTGTYGRLTLNADGSHTYVVDDGNAVVQALRTSSDTLTDAFSYTMRDAAGLTSNAMLTVTIQGANDAPLGVNDTAIAVEAGGVANGTPGGTGTGNVLINDTDIDAGDSKTATAVRTGSEAGVGVVGAIGTGLNGQYGSLTLNADGSYTYVVDDNNAAVQALHTAANTLNDTFTYTMRDTLGLTDAAQLTIVIRGSNDAPTAVNDTAVAVEAGGTLNTTPGSNGAGNVLTNDADVDAGDGKSVINVRSGAEAGSGAASSVGTGLNGQYGSLTLNADGSYTYVVDDDNAVVQALRTGADTLADTFTYTMRDTFGLTDIAELTITIQGRNDAPVAANDFSVAIEAGGVNNATPGSNGTGSVLIGLLGADTDVDVGDGRTVTAVRTGAEAATGSAGAIGAALAGQYGSLTLNSDGTYTYVIDNANASVQLLVPGSILTDIFTYVVTDTGLLSDAAQLVVIIGGAGDNPVASDDHAQAQAVAIAGGAVVGGVVVGGVELGAPVNPTGNVILNASQPGAIDSPATGPGDPAGNGIDADVDQIDQPNSNLVLNGIRSGTELAGGGLIGVTAGTTSVNGTSITGSYGTLTIGADGSFLYTVDSRNATVQALAAGVTLSDAFTYGIIDTEGLPDFGELVVQVVGVNDPPIAQNVTSFAREAGGISNGTLGVDPSGDATANDIDPDGNPISVIAIRTGAEAGAGVAGSVGSALAGQYGSLTLNADGSFNYIVDNANAAVQALRTTGNTLSDTFTYTNSDGAAGTDTAEIVVIIRGANDNPVGTDDAATADERGGLNNAVAGANATGNALNNDSDVDAVANGETMAVSAIRTGTESGTGVAGSIGAALVSQYGSLTLNADGNYVYLVDNANAAVQALRTTGNTLIENFTYTVVDASGATGLAQLTITIRGANDDPTAVNDTATAVEAGGLGNATPGSNGTGNVLANDTDVDSVANGETNTVQSIAGGAVNGTTTGAYGALTLNADGNYTYVIDNANLAVQALRGSADTLDETFTYTMRDAAGATSTALLSITLRGANDSPVAVNDVADAVEAGGIGNATPGTNPAGNVLLNDSDVDGVAYGETASVSAVSGAAAGVVGGVTAGAFGTLRLNADGTYVYTVDNSNAAVEALRTPAETLSDAFSYRIQDAGGLSASASLTITIRGSNDTPRAVRNIGVAWPPGTLPPFELGRNPTGNVLNNDTDVDAGDTRAVISIDNGISPAAVSPGTDVNNGQVITGNYGTLTIGADGGYRYVVDTGNPDVLALDNILDVLNDVFTYTMRDTVGATASVTLTIQVRGTNDAPTAVDDAALATDSVRPPTVTGSVLFNDIDIDANDTLSVSAVRAGPEAGVGAAGVVGTALPGMYGSLVLNADGTFRYEIDLTNPAVLAAAGRGPLLTDTFTYTVSDFLGSTDVAQLVVTLVITEPTREFPGSGFIQAYKSPVADGGVQLNFEPIVYVERAVRAVELLANLTERRTDGAKPWFTERLTIRSTSIGAALGTVADTFVQRAVEESRYFSQYDASIIDSREGVVTLTADGLVGEFTLFSVDDNELQDQPPVTDGVPVSSNAPSFSDQLRRSVAGVRPLAGFGNTSAL